MDIIKFQNQRYFKDFARFNIDDFTKNNPYEVLNYNVGDDIQAVRKAYFKLLKKYHPDNFLDENNTIIQEEVNKIAMLINWAFAEYTRLHWRSKDN